MLSSAKILIVHLTWLVASISASSCSRRWCKFNIWECMNESLALAQWNTANVHGCILRTSSSSADDLVAQWNAQTGLCSLFNYQQVCRLMSSSGQAAVPIGGDEKSIASHCSVYRTAALVSCTASLNARFQGVWLAGGSSRFSNLVCQSDPNYQSKQSNLISVNLQWTEEGAVFDGVSSYALLNDSRFLDTDTSSGFTWLMRLKRQPKIQPLIETVSCSNFQAIGRHFWEYPSSNQLYFNKFLQTSDSSNFRLKSSENVLPNSTSEWINIGILMSSDASRSAFFVNGRLVNQTVLVKDSVSDFPCLVLCIGRRYNGGYLSGVVRAVASANVTMTAQEVRDFFAALP